MKTQSITIDDLTFGEAMAFKAIAQELKLAKEKHPKWIKGLPVQTLVVIEEKTDYNLLKIIPMHLKVKSDREPFCRNVFDYIFFGLDKDDFVNNLFTMVLRNISAN